MARFDTLADLPGQAPVIWRRTRAAIPLAALAGILWPPLILTLLVWPPQNWIPGRDIDWRLTVLLIGMIAVATGMNGLYLFLSAGLGGFLAQAALLVAFLDVVGLPLLFVGVTGF